jgi:hypothetical protein
MISVTETFSKPRRLKSLRAVSIILFFVSARCPAA